MYRGIATLIPMPFSHRCSVFILTGGDVILTCERVAQLVFGQQLNLVGRTFHYEETMGLVGNQRVNSTKCVMIICWQGERCLYGFRWFCSLLCNTNVCRPWPLGACLELGSLMVCRMMIAAFASPSLVLLKNMQLWLGAQLRMLGPFLLLSSQLL